MSEEFGFAAAAEELVPLAKGIEPDGMMQVLTACESEMPAAVSAMAAAFAAFAEQCDDEWPLEKDVANAIMEVHDLLKKAEAVAEEIGSVFRSAHEQDIARHEEPRNGSEAERKWNVGEGDAA